MVATVLFNNKLKISLLQSGMVLALPEIVCIQIQQFFSRVLSVGNGRKNQFSVSNPKSLFESHFIRLSISRIMSI